MIGLRTALMVSVVLVACNGDEGPTGPARAEISETSIDFGPVAVGTSAEQRVTLSNPGGSPLEVRSVTLVQGDSSVWRWARDPDGDVPPGASVDLVVTFEPDVPDAEEAGRLQIRTSDTSTGPLTIDLSGAGAPSTVDGDEDGFSPADGDCNDGRADVYPGAPELCDGRDNDCDGETPADEADADRDGARVCAGDCDDDDDDVRPGAPEICDDKDSDCDGVNPDRADADGDGFSICDDDCDDDDDQVSRGLEEVCDGRDNDCSGQADDIDADGDGRSVCRGDCDDDDSSAYSVAVDPGANPEEPDGTDAAPYRGLDEALANLDATCRTVFLFDDTYEVGLDLSGEVVTLVGETREGTVLQPIEGQVARLGDGASLTLRRLTLTGGAGTGDGGAIEASFSDLALDDVLVRDNSGGADGGVVTVAGGNLVLNRVEARDNTAADDGGAFAVFSGTLDVADSTFTGNVGNRGGALLAEGSRVQIRDSVFTANEARDKGGAIQVLGGAGHVVERVDLRSNTAANAGGALALQDIVDDDAVFRNMTVMENDGGSVGGGIAISGETAALRVANSTLTGNAATDAGAGIHVASTSASGIDLVGNIVAWSDGGSGIETQPDSGARVRYCLGYSTSPGADFAGGAEVDADGNLSDNPLFVSWDDDGDPDDDLALSSGSPAIDAGPPDASFDDPDGSRNDIGVTGGPAAR